MAETNLASVAEDALKLNEERYRSLFDRSLDVIYLHDFEGNFIDANPSAFSLMGYGKEELPSLNLLDLISPDQLPLLQQKLRELKETGTQKAKTEFKIRRKDGEYSILETTASVIEQEGIPLLIQGIARDVTDQRQAERIMVAQRDLGIALTEATSLQQALRLCLDAAIEVSGLDSGGIYTMDPVTGDLNLACHKGLSEGFVDAVRHAPADSDRGMLVTAGKPAYLEQTDSLVAGPQELREEGIKSIAVIPIGYQGRIVGDINIASHLLDKIPLHGRNALEAIAAQIGMSIVKVKTEETLRESEKKYRSLFEVASDALLVLDEESGNILDANGEALRMYGYGREELIGMKSADLFDSRPEGLEGIVSLNRHPSRGFHRRKEGTLFPVETTASVMKMEGSGTRIVAVRDITGRMEAEKEILWKTAFLEALVESTGDGIMVVDDQGKRILANRNYLEMRNVPEHIRNTQEDAPLLRHATEEAADPQQFIEKVRYLYDHPDETSRDEIELKNGLIVERHSSPVLGKDGRYYGRIWTLRDITDRRRSEERYRTIFENAVMGIFQSSPEGRIINANPAFARILGYDSPEDVLASLTDMPRQMYVQPERRAELLRIMNEQGTHSEQEVHYYRKDRSTVWVAVIGSAVRDDQGKLLYYQGTIQDITARKSLEYRLRQAQKMEAIGTLAGGIAHDFNNILGAIIGYTELSLQEPGENQRQRRYLEQIFKAAKRAGDLVKQILTFSRQTEETLLPLRISPIVTEVLKLLRASLPSTVEVRQNIQSDPDTILASSTHIHQILMNLCTNAAHAMRDKKGVLSIGLEPVEIRPGEILTAQGLLPGSHIRLTVSDTGCGIDPGILEKIFDPFFTTKKPGEGTGMGLSVVHGIVMSCRGAITVRSEVGKGTEFQVYFPLLIDTAGEEGGDAAAPLPIARGSERILFVDDEELLVSLGKEMLTGLGYEVTGCANSPEALQLFRTRPDRFDLVITDMTMPNLTGLELARELFSIRPDLPVILCTGFSETVTPQKAKSLGIREFVMKPVAFDQLAMTIRKTLDRKE